MGNSVVMAVWDVDQEAFGRPFFCRREQEGVRMFASEVNREDSQNLLNSHPDSFQLYQLAEFNEETGEFLGMPRMIISARNCKALKGGSDVSE